MSKEQIFGIIRHSLTFIGGALVTTGVLEEGMATELVGASLTLVGIIWSLIEKNA